MENYEQKNWVFPRWCMILRHVINRYVIWNKKNANQITETFVKTSVAKSNHVSSRESPSMGLFIESTIYNCGVFELNIKFIIHLVRYTRKFFDRSVDAQWELLFFWWYKNGIPEASHECLEISIVYKTIGLTRSRIAAPFVNLQSCQ